MLLWIHLSCSIMDFLHSVFMFGTYSQNVFMSQHLTTTLQTNRTVTLLIISLKSEMLWGRGVGALNNFQYVLESVDGYRPGKV